MSEVVKVYIGIFFLLVISLLGCGIVSAQLDSSYAREYKQAVVYEIEESGFSPRVMSACSKQAQTQGYELILTVYRSGESPMLFHGGEELNIEDIAMVEVQLKYKYRITLLNYCTDHCVRGYAV